MKTVAVIGLGYFSQFHLEAWTKNPNVDLVAVADTNPDRLAAVSNEPHVASYAYLDSVLEQHRPDIVDLVVPPAAHARLIRKLLTPGQVIVCQKPFCTSLAEAEQITAEAEAAGATLIIHENFRFQPWYRAVKSFLDSGQMGQIYSAQFNLRPGDGRGADAYLARQPSFQTMPRFMVQETGVHFLDVFRWLFGPISSVYADLRRLNPAIEGEDAGTLILTHSNGIRAVLDANRLSDHVADNPRHTMGEMVIEGAGGTLSVMGDGKLRFRAFGTQKVEDIPLTAPVDPNRFGGGCVEALITHVVETLLAEQTPENTARDYLNVIRLVEAAYQSNEEGRQISIP